MPTDSNTRSPYGFAIVLAVLCILLVIVACFIWSIGKGQKPNPLEARRAAARVAVREKLDGEASTVLQTDGWVDRSKGIARVPVAEVFEVIAKDLGAKKPAPSSVKIEPPLPMPVIDPKSSEPPPPAMPSAPQGADTIHFTSNTEK